MRGVVESEDRLGYAFQTGTQCSACNYFSFLIENFGLSDLQERARKGSASEHDTIGARRRNGPRGSLGFMDSTGWQMIS